MQQDDPNEPPAEADASPSRTRRKRDAEGLQRLGEALLAVPPARLPELALPEALHDAVAQAHRIPGRGGQRRQRQLIGKLMRDVDPVPIESALRELHGTSLQAAAIHRQAEAWRERLLAEGRPAVTAFIAGHPGADQQRLRQLLGKAAREETAGRPPRAARDLFRLIREALMSRDGGSQHL